MAKKKVINYTNDEIAAVIDFYIHNKRNRLILKRRYIDGICLEPLSEEFDLSVSQVKNIIYHNENTIFSHLENEAP